MKTCVIFNPVAKGNKARRFREALGALERDCTLMPTLRAGDARRLAEESVKEGYDTVVAAGGDGTVNEVVNGIADAPEGLERARFAALPLGTVNVFARELRLPLNFRGAWDCLRSAREISIDLPCVNYQLQGAPARRYFVQMAGAGFDARTEELVQWEMKKRFGKIAYVLAVLKAMREPGPIITVEDGRRRLSGEFVVIGNGRYYAGSFPVFPHANFQDGLLEVTVVRKANIIAALRSGLGLALNQLYSWGGAQYMQAARLTVSSDSRALFHVEGENVGPLPAHVSIGEKKLRVLAP